MSDSGSKKKKKKLLSVLGLGVKSGNIIIGVPLICEALKGRRNGGKYPLIVFEASDTSENTHKRISDRCGYYNVLHIRLQTDVNTLCFALGKRSMTAAAALTNEQLSRLAQRYI